jgi:hypothetical protein
MRNVASRARTVAIATQSPSAIGVLAFKTGCLDHQGGAGQIQLGVMRKSASTSSASERPWQRSTRL